MDQLASDLRNGNTCSSMIAPYESRNQTKEVWAYNLIEEAFKICGLVKKYRYVAMDTEFPGKPLYPTNIGDPNFAIQNATENVNMTKLIQVGITLMDENGEMPEDTQSWEFNLEFDVNKDFYASDAIEILQSSGLDFQKHKTQGIKHFNFAEIFYQIGLACNPGVTWIGFSIAFDFCHLLKVVKGEDKLHYEKMEEFKEDVKWFFPNVFDVKEVGPKFGFWGGLEAMATKIEIRRQGNQHRAGSDSRLTGQVFFKIVQENTRGLDDRRLMEKKGEITGFEEDRLKRSVAWNAAQDNREQD